MSFLDSTLGYEDTTGSALRQTTQDQEAAARAGYSRLDELFGTGDTGPGFEQAQADNLAYTKPLLEEKQARERDQTAFGLQRRGLLASSAGITATTRQQQQQGRETLDAAQAARSAALAYQAQMASARSRLLQQLTGTIDTSTAINAQMADVGRGVTPAYNPIGDAVSGGINLLANNEYARASGARGLGFALTNLDSYTDPYRPAPNVAAPGGPSSL